MLVKKSINIIPGAILLFIPYILLSQLHCELCLATAIYQLWKNLPCISTHDRPDEACAYRLINWRALRFDVEKEKGVWLG
jgi:hypothetical protein